MINLVADVVSFCFKWLMSPGGKWNADFQMQVCDTAHNSSILICITPALELPTVIQSYMDSIDPEFNHTRSLENGWEYVPPEMTSLLDRGHVDDGRNNAMYIYVGVTFDRNSRNGNLTEKLGVNGSMVIVPGPTLIQSTHQIDYHADTYSSAEPFKIWVSDL